jgi:hypothetical protein
MNQIPDYLNKINYHFLTNQKEEIIKGTLIL